MANKKYRPSAEEFVQIWQSSKNKKEITKRTGYVAATVDKKASALRKLGVPLKKFRPGRKPGSQRWIKPDDRGRLDALKALANHYNIEAE